MRELVIGLLRVINGASGAGCTTLAFDVQQ